MHVRVDEAGQDMLPLHVDDAGRVGQRVVGVDRDDPAAGDGDAPVEGLLRRHDLSVLDDEICFHLLSLSFEFS